MLARFVVLSMLLHLLVVVLFGTAPGGGANRGEPLLGALDVTLRRLSPERGAGIRLAPGAETTTPGSALLGRPGDAPRARTPAAPSPVEPRAPVTPPEPAAPITDAMPPADTTPAPADAAPAPPPADAMPPPVPPSSPAQPPAFEVLPRLDLKAPEIVDKPLPPVAPVAPPKIERERAAAPAPAPRELPFTAPEPIERIAPERVTRELAPPIAPPPREVPFTAPAPIERIAPERVVRELAPPIAPPPREVPFTPPAPIERIAPERVVRELAAPIAPPQELPAPAAIERDAGFPADLPATRPAAADRAPPAAGMTPSAARDAVPARTSPGSEPAAAAPRGDRTIAPAGAAEAPTTRDAPARAGVPSGAATPGQRIGAPDADDIFRPRDDSATPAPRAEPRIDLDATRRRAREIASEDRGSPGVLNLVPPPPPEAKKFDLGKAIAKAAKPDCRNAYAELGLLAIPPLIASTLGDGGCRW